MAFISYSAGLTFENQTVVSNIFCEEHLPNMNGDVARVYLYGLYFCNKSDRPDNCIENFACHLSLDVQDVKSAFMDLVERGLVMVEGDFVGVKYLPVRSGSAKIKKYAVGKYDDFNAQMQAVIEGRMITPTEFQEYYALMEYMNIESAAMVMIAKYCVDLKGATIGYQYIINVAKKWAYAGVKTAGAVEDKLISHAFDTSAVASVLKKLKIKRNADSDDYNNLEKWRALGFALPEIESIAAYCEKVGKKTFEDIDAEVMRFAGAGATNVNAINAYIDGQLSKDKTIRDLLRRLGLSRTVVQIDRDFYNTWTVTWAFAPDVIDYAATLAVGQASPMAYINKILSTYFDKKITTVDKAVHTPISFPSVNITRHSYGSDKLNKLFGDGEK